MKLVITTQQYELVDGVWTYTTNDHWHVNNVPDDAQAKDIVHRLGSQLWYKTETRASDARDSFFQNDDWRSPEGHQEIQVEYRELFG